MGLSEIRVLYPKLAAMPDATLGIWLQQAEEWVRSYYGRDFSPGVKIDHFSSQNDQVLFLRSTPVRSLRRVCVNGQRWQSCDNRIKFSSDGMVFMEGNTFWNQLTGWSPGVNNIAIEYVSEGMSDITQASLYGAVINWQYEASQVMALGGSERIGDYYYMSMGGASAGTGNAPPHVVQKLFAPYVRRLAC